MVGRLVRVLMGAMVAASATAVPAGSAQAEPATLAPVIDLQVAPEIGLVTLRWTDPANPDGDGVVYCEDPGTTPPTRPRAYCLANNVERSSTFLMGHTPTDTMTYTVWSRDRAGNLGPGESVTVFGTETEMSTVPSSDGAVTGIRLAGRMADAWTGSPLAGTDIGIYAYRPLAKPGPQGHFEDELVATLTTDAQGRFSRDFPLRPGWDYQARYDGGPTRIGNLSRLVPADGSSYISLTSPDGDDLARSRGRSVVLLAEVPRVRARDLIVFQTMSKGRWRTVATKELRTSRKATLRVRVPGRARPVYRAKLVQVGRAAQPSVPLRIRRG